MQKHLSDNKLFKTMGYIDGEWVDASNSAKFDVIDPGNGDIIAHVSELGVAEVKKAALAATKALNIFKKNTPRKRAELLRKWTNLMIENSDDLAKLVCLENGKTYSEALGEVKYAASYLEWYAEEAPRIYGDTLSTQNANNRTYTIKEPIGVCGFITPWNFPLAMIARKVGAAIAAGCTVVIKPAGETPLSALAIAYLSEIVGFPKGVINIVTSNVNTKSVGKELCQNKLIRKLSFTGSTETGKLLMEQCSGSLKKLSLELGGNAPFIVFPDADIDSAIEGILVCKYRGAGQTCVCANRIFVHESIYEVFSTRLIEEVKKFKIGYSLEEGVTIGPLIHQNALNKVQSHVRDAVSKGAQLLLGGKILEKLGNNYYAPTVLGGVTIEMLCSMEETFGPVASLIQFKTEGEVIRMANECNVGLASYFYTKDLSCAYRVAESLETGMVGVNVGAISDCAFPFGGIKASGFGREGSKYGIDDYLTIKSVTVGI
ncbi:uncharacterized protein AC631_03449 [Debaryomyces fabryi]|uniref:Succinate-semialdehyde dehydrogenase n=1 Tax=Debaryomyces fabryi TaxID=58627 RepID=A0A0V1PXA8_9ASCO|nr:uncharacterized protein AC631_03449 [Debaryomyces fabryi]KSA00800.1 hypothetical protein AC631_03449 [Debaryomyces fabryi]CUM55103.1 unnamed protein product [Debaryomyces fabryi]